MGCVVSFTHRSGARSKGRYDPAATHIAWECAFELFNRRFVLHTMYGFRFSYLEYIPGSYPRVPTLAAAAARRLTLGLLDDGLTSIPGPP